MNFFRNYTRLVGVAYFAIVMLTLGFLAHQINQKRAEEIDVIRGSVQRHSQLIQFILRSSGDYINAMRISASISYTNSPIDLNDSRRESKHSLMFRRLKSAAGQTTFNFDSIGEPDSNGNLTGNGSLEGRLPEFYRDMEMALSLSQVFQAIGLNLPNAAEARFVSVDQFSNVYPWHDSTKSPFSKAVYSTSTWQKGLPEANPSREKYWSPVYYAGPDKGLLVPIAAPIYDGERFRGVVSIDTSLDFLNRINNDFGYALGTVFLVDGYGKIVAHPKLFENPLQVKDAPALKDVMPAAILDGNPLESLPAGEPINIGEYIVIRTPFISAPWNLVYVLPQKDLTWKLLAERGPGMLAVILSLTILMLITYWITAREFISPASKLVTHIALAAKFTPSPIPAVPGAWRPWFESISMAFSDSLQAIEFRQELDIAANMQQAILPRTWPEQREFSLWGRLRPAKEVGGDFFDHFQLADGKIGIVVADVSGKGAGPAIFGAVAKTFLRASAVQQDVQPAAAMEAVNDFMSRDNDNMTFVTTFYAIFDPATGSMTFVNAGHPPPMIIHADGRIEFLSGIDGPAIGVAEEIPFNQQTITLQPGDFVMIYTDGVTEAFNHQWNLFGEERLGTVFANSPPSDVHDAVTRVIAAVDQYAGGAPQSDDITVVTLEYHHPIGAPTVAGGVTDRVQT